MSYSVEELSAIIHGIYCTEYEKQNGVPYHTGGDYLKLSNEMKEYDRNIARFVLKHREDAIRSVIRIIENGSFLSDNSPVAKWAKELVSAINRELLEAAYHE
jgi:hypothetical protein